MSEPQRQLALGESAEQPRPDAGQPSEALPTQAPEQPLTAAAEPAARGEPAALETNEAELAVADVAPAHDEPEAVAVVVPKVSLKQGREARGWTLEEAARRLRLSVAQVDAIERRDWANLPAQAYCQGFIKNYARLVDLDPSDDLIALSEHYRQLRPSDLLRDDPLTLARYDEAGALRNKTSANPVLIGGAVLLAVLAVVVGVFGERLISMAGLSAWMSKSETIVLPPKAAVETVVSPTPSPAPAATAAPVGVSVIPAPTMADAQTAAAAPAESTPAASVAGPAVPAAPAPAPTALPAAGLAPAAAMAAPGERRVRLVYRADAWVEIRDASGSILVSQLNRAGSEQVLSGKPPLRLVIGSADGVSLEADGKAVDLTPYKQANVARMTLN